MKISVDVDCTPQEMRRFFGLPDVEPMQQAVMEEMGRQLVSSMDELSPTTLMKEWFAPMTAMHQAFLGSLGSPSSTASGGPKRGRTARDKPGRAD